MTNTPYQKHHKSKKATILVIEDNADQWFLIRWALQQRFPEVDAIWMPEATQAVMYLETCVQTGCELPKLVLLDLYLPDRQQGCNLLQILKAHHIYREIPVVVLSYSNDKDDISESYALRSNSYIVKPSGYDKWLECITSFRHYWWEAVTLPKYI
ncbi:response regulator [Spirosoma sp.]|uniref:response regulator n=1 Tax=Spirosoma sp. TaxID=1899569 RepID=UPI003B3BD617